MKQAHKVLTIVGLCFYTIHAHQDPDDTSSTKNIMVIHPDLMHTQQETQENQTPMQQPETQKEMSPTGQAVLELCSQVAGQVSTIISNKHDPIAKAQGIKEIIQLIIAGIANIIQKRREAKRLKKLNQTKRSPYFVDDEDDDLDVHEIMKQAFQELYQHNELILEQKEI